MQCLYHQSWRQQKDRLKFRRARELAHTLPAARERVTRNLEPSDINNYIRERTGGDFTAKDFRTLRGTLVAAQELATAATASTPAGRKKVVSDVMRTVAGELGNTPAVARASYVDPRVIDLCNHGRTMDLRGRASAEHRLLSLLDACVYSF